MKSLEGQAEDSAFDPGQNREPWIIEWVGDIDLQLRKNQFDNWKKWGET